MGSVAAQLQLIQQLEGQLLKLRKEKSFVDPALREARRQFRATAEAILLENYRIALEKGIETKLWHLCFHRPVQEFRRRIQERTLKGESNKELVLKLKKAFGALLADGATFYKAMAYRLQLRYGKVGYKPTTQELAEIAKQPSNVKAAEAPMDTRASVHRCLICIGDLTRYNLQMETDEKVDWSIADDFYCQAIRVFPEGGNAYNQRAVLAAHEERDLQAVYFYVRSLAVASPFSVAKENLVQLFEKVRLEAGKLPQPGQSKDMQRPAAGWKLPELSKLVQTRFLRLHGLLFTAIDFDTFGSLLKAALSELDQLLGRAVVVRGPVGHGPERSDVALLQLAAVTIWIATQTCSSSQLATSTSETAKQTALKRSSLDLFFIYTSRLCQVVASAAGEMPKGVADSPLLPTIDMLLQWIATNPDLLRYPEADATVGRNFLCKALSEFTVAIAASCEKAGMSASEALQSHTDILKALPEDLEMRAFTPLLRVQRDLDYTCALEGQAAVLPRLKRVIVLLHKIGEGLHAAQGSDHADNTVGGKMISHFLSKLTSSLQSIPDALHSPSEAPPASIVPQMDAADQEVEEEIVFNPSPAPKTEQAQAQAQLPTNGTAAESTNPEGLGSLIDEAVDHYSIGMGQHEAVPMEMAQTGTEGMPYHDDHLSDLQASKAQQQQQHPQRPPSPAPPTDTARPDLYADARPPYRGDFPPETSMEIDTGFARGEPAAVEAVNFSAQREDPSPLWGLQSVMPGRPVSQSVLSEAHGTSNHASRLHSAEHPAAPRSMDDGGQYARPDSLLPGLGGTPRQAASPDVLLETQEQLARQEPAVSSGIQASVARLDALGDSGTEGHINRHLPGRSASNPPGMPDPDVVKGLDESMQRPYSAAVTRPPSRLGSHSLQPARASTSLDAAMQAPLHASAFQAPKWPGQGPISADASAADHAWKLPEGQLHGTSGGSSLGEDRLQARPPQFSLPQTSWSSGTGVHIPVQAPVNGGTAQDQASNLSMQQPYSLRQNPTHNQLNNLYSRISRTSQASQPGQLAQPSQPGQYPSAQYGLPQLGSQYQQPRGPASDQQLQALLNQLNQAKQQPSTGHTHYPVPNPLQQAPAGIPDSLRAQLAQTREQPRGLAQSISGAGIPGQSPASGASFPGRIPRYPSMQHSQTGNTLARYHGLLQNYPGQQISPDQLVGSSGSLSGLTGLQNGATPAGTDPLQLYLQGGAVGLQGSPHSSVGLHSGLPNLGQGPGSAQQQLLNAGVANWDSALPGRMSGSTGNGVDMVGNAMPPFRGPASYGPQDLDRTSGNNIADLVALQRLLAASGKDCSLDAVLELQRGIQQPQREHVQRGLNQTDSVMQQMLQSGSASAAQQRHLPERDPMAGLQRHLTAPNQDLTMARANSGASHASAALRDAQPAAWGSGSERAAPSRQSSIGRGADLASALRGMRTPGSLQQQGSQGHAGLSGLLNAAPGSANGWRESPSAAGRPQDGALELEESRLPQTDARTHGRPGSAQDAPQGNVQKAEWGPFTGLGSAYSGPAWSQPWSGNLQVKDNPPPANPWEGHSQLGVPGSSGAKSGRQTPASQPPSASELSRLLGVPGHGQSRAEPDWQAQLDSLQAARNQPEALPGRVTPVHQEGQQQMRGEPVGGHDRRPSSYSSLFGESNPSAGRRGSELDPMIPSWLQTTSQGSGVWGAPQRPPASGDGRDSGIAGGSTDWLERLQQQQRQQQEGDNYRGAGGGLP